jgi:hypothetical protein
MSQTLTTRFDRALSPKIKGIISRYTRLELKRNKGLKDLRKSAVNGIYKNLLKDTNITNELKRKACGSPIYYERELNYNYECANWTFYNYYRKLREDILMEQIKRQLLIAYYKNQDNPECFIAKLPKDIIRFIIELIKQK